MLTPESQVLRTIRLERMLRGGETVLVALSGGADSTALLLILLGLRGRLGVNVLAGHVNHGLRGAESDGDEAFAAELCRRLEVPFQSAKLPGQEASGRGNLEQRLRKRRYRALFEMAAPAKAVVATAHTLDDQAETFLMKMARGAGPTGLGGIFPVRRNQVAVGEGTVSIKVVRPLIGCRREDVRDYLRRIGQAWREDPTNRDPARDRNWVRLDLLPRMRRLNPRVVENIAREARLFREIEDWMRRGAEAALLDCLTERRGEGPALRVDGLRRLPTALAMETVRRAIGRARGSMTRVSHRNVTDVLALLKATSGRSVDLPGGWRARREYDEIRLIAEAGVDFEVELSLPGEIFVYPTGKRLRAERFSESGEPTGTMVCLGLSAKRLIVRNRRPGDRMMLEGRWAKLKDLFQRRRIPLGRRNRLLIVESDGDLAWVEEVGVDDRFRPSPDRPATHRLVVVDETFEARDGSKRA